MDERRRRLKLLVTRLAGQFDGRDMAAEIDAAPDALTLDIIRAELECAAGEELERVAAGLARFGLPGEAARARTAARLAQVDLERYAAQAKA